MSSSLIVNVTKSKCIAMLFDLLDSVEVLNIGIVYMFKDILFIQTHTNQLQSSGSYFLVRCKIFVVRNNSTDTCITGNITGPTIQQALVPPFMSLDTPLT